MTEAEWLACEAPGEMLKQLRWKADYLRFRKPWKTSDRRFRLASCACCQRVRHRLERRWSDEETQTALDLSERFADDPQNDSLRQSLSEVAAALIGMSTGPHFVEFEGTVVSAIANAVQPPREGDDYVQYAIQAIWLALEPSNRLRSVQFSRLLRCVFGNPFQPVAINPEWLSSTVTAMAQQMYDARDFSTMPILADALQDAGCDNDAILNHSRDGNGVHVRGCWVVDLILGKT